MPAGVSIAAETANAQAISPTDNTALRLVIFILKAPSECADLRQSGLRLQSDQRGSRQYMAEFPADLPRRIANLDRQVVHATLAHIMRYARHAHCRHDLARGIADRCRYTADIVVIFGEAKGAACPGKVV